MKLPFQHVNTKNDISYGIYIYGTLILNILTAGGCNKSFWSYFGISLILTLIMAYLSWFLIEKPALRLKSLFNKTIF
jgi:peptidoglycan/LPS O-acetylase OafA/YrhL